MRMFVISASTLAALALASIATPSLAGSAYYDLPQAPARAGIYNPTNPGMWYAQPDGAGQFDCQRGEKRTRLQRRNCGPMKRIGGSAQVY